VIAICVECWDEYSARRKELGYKTCLDCGEANARTEVARKAKCMAPAYNKGRISMSEQLKQQKE